MKDKIKKLSALLCAVAVSCLSCVSAFAVDISKMTRLEMQQYIHGTTSTFRYDVEIPKSSIENIADFLDLKNNKIPAFINSNGELEEQTDRYENIVNSAKCDLSDIVYDVFVFGNNEVIYVNWVYYVKSDTAKFTMDNYNATNFGFNFNEKCFYSRTPYVYNETTNSYKLTGGAYMGVDYQKMPNASWLIPKDYTCYYYSNNAGTPAFDENGNELEIFKIKPNINFTIEPHLTFDDYGVSDCYFDFRIESDKNIVAMLELYEGDSDINISNENLWLNEYTLGEKFNPTQKPIYRYNYSEYLSEKQKVKVTLNYNQMLNREFPDQIQWWVQFFKNDEYGTANGVTDEDLKSVISAIENRDDWHTYWVGNKKMSSKPPYTADKVYQYLKWRTEDKWFNLDLFIGNFGNALENRAKNSVQTISVYADDMQNKKMYSASMLITSGSNKHGTINAKNIDYKPNSNYYWVLSYEMIDMSEISSFKERYLQNPLFADYFVWTSPNQKIAYEPLPYGDGLSGQQNIYDEDNNLFGTMGDDVINVNPDNDKIKNEFGNLTLDTSDLNSLFESSTGFFAFLKTGFSILPAFIWSLIGGFIAVLIFLRVMGR